MKKNTGADELQKAITAKQAEIEAIAGEIKAAAGSFPYRLLLPGRIKPAAVGLSCCCLLQWALPLPAL